jgi:putative ABC transport system permease protein
MLLKEYFKIAIKNLRTRPIRSWLTIFGIVIGVFLIVSLLSLSEGVKQTINKQLQMMGGDVIMVLPGEFSDIITTMFGGSELSEEDIRAIKKAEGVDLALPMRYKAELVRYKNQQKTSLIYGLPMREGMDALKDQMGWTLTEGEWPIINKREVILGSLIPEEIFPGIGVGDEIKIGGQRYDVVGILVSLGSKQDDQMIGMDLELFGELTGDRRGAPMVFVTVRPGYTADEVAENIEERLEETRKRKRGEDLPPFSVITSEKIAGIAGNILDVVQIAVLLFASIGMVVGGIGIMNTMYTSVHERTKEIGIMKAIGAKSSTITMIFLVESGVVGLMGGIGGTVLGLGLAKLVELYGDAHPVLYIDASVSPFIAFFGLAFSFLVGCISGFLPARKASKLKPVDALRYE